MLNKITETEYKMMKLYRDWYGWQDEPAYSAPTMPIREVLTEWESANGTLYKLLGNNLKVSKEIEFKKSVSQLKDDISYALAKYRSDWSEYPDRPRIERDARIFEKNYREWIKETYPTHRERFWFDEELTEQQKEENRINLSIVDALQLLIGYTSLARNQYIGDEVTIILPDGKPYKIRSGCKPLKPLAKIAAAYNIEGFEDFRIVHSQILNQKSIKGELTLSIHPLDYWTMSDNNSGWSSCMSWEDTGGYRQGTVEMMNSPCVIVAYLAAKEPMSIGHNHEWNNKKWRCLMIADEQVIASVKNYPYSNDELTQTALTWIKELAEQNLGWKYWNESPIKYDVEDSYTNPNIEDATPFTMTFCCGHMYCDFGSSSNSYIYFKHDLDGADMPKNAWNNKVGLTFNYSGASQCMSCGELVDEFDDSSNLVCDRCEHICRCAECGERLYGDEYYSVEGATLCESCYNDLSVRCSWCDEDYFEDNVETLHVLMPTHYMDINEYCEAVKPMTGFYKLEGYKHSIELGQWTVCDECLKGIKERDLKPGASLFRYTDDCCSYRLGVYITDIKENKIGDYLTNSLWYEWSKEQNLLKLAQNCSHYDHLFMKVDRENAV